VTTVKISDLQTTMQALETAAKTIVAVIPQPQNRVTIVSKG